jgi:hypothetical protein
VRAGVCAASVVLAGALVARAQSPYVEVGIDRSLVSGGDTAVLTVRVLRLHPRQLSIVGLVSRVGSQRYLWPLALSMR